MSNDIKDEVSGKKVFTNVSGSSIMIGQYAFHFSELLPVILHYAKGGLFGHAPKASNAKLSELIPWDVLIEAQELTAIEEFINRAKALTKVTLPDGNVQFRENEEKRE